VVGWEIYIDGIQGQYNEEITLEFVVTLKEDKAQALRVPIVVNEELFFVVTWMPQEGEQWFSQKKKLPGIKD